MYSGYVKLWFSHKGYCKFNVWIHYNAPIPSDCSEPKCNFNNL